MKKRIMMAVLILALAVTFVGAQEGIGYRGASSTTGLGYVTLADTDTLGSSGHILNGRLWWTIDWAFGIGPLSFGPELGIGMMFAPVTANGQDYSSFLIDMNVMLNVRFQLAFLAVEGLAGYSNRDGFGAADTERGTYWALGARGVVGPISLTGLMHLPADTVAFAVEPAINDGVLLELVVGWENF